MRYVLTTAALLLGLVPAGLAQSTSPWGCGNLAKHPDVRINYVESTTSWYPELVEVRGTSLNLVTAARVNGVEVPIVANNGRRLMLDVEQQDPGFGVLELAQGQGVVQGAIEFTPSLAARMSGGQVQFRLNAGGEGWYLLYYSFAREDMCVFPGVYYGLLLDLDAPLSGVMWSGSLGMGPEVTPWMPVPRGVFGPGGLASTRPMRAQALCIYDVESCYTNMVTLRQPTL